MTAMRLLGELEKELTCGICKDIFQEPLSLTCQHRYCRICVQDLVNNSTTNGLHSRPTLCPECRTPIVLSQRGVPDIPTDFKLAGIIRIFKESSCVSAADRPVIQCNVHFHAYFIYCVTCQDLLCKRCLGDHDQHSLKDIDMACDTRKAPLEEKVRDFEEMKLRLAEFEADCLEINNRAQRKEEHCKRELRRAYVKAMKDLNIWMKDAEDAVVKEYGEFHSECDRVIRNLQSHAHNIDEFIKISKKLLSEEATHFLKKVNQLWERIGTFQRAFERSITEHEKKTKELRVSLDIACVVPKHVTVKEVPTEQELQTRTSPKQLMLLESNCEEGNRQEMRPNPLQSNTRVSQEWICEGSANHPRTEPQLKFTRIFQDKLEISENGTLLKCNSMDPYNNYEGWTNGRFQSGRWCWKIDVTFASSPVSEYECVCAAGVVHGASGLRDRPGKSSWYIGMEYNNGEVSCYSHGNHSAIQQPYNRRTTNTGSVSLLFYLDCNDRVLEVIDNTENRVMCRIGQVDTSTPLTPAVRFWSTDCTRTSMSAKLSCQLH